MFSYDTILIEEDIKLLLSKTLEPLPVLLEAVRLSSECQNRFKSIRSESKKQQFLMARALMKEAGLKPESLYYGNNRKPFFESGAYVSVSHSGSYVGVTISKHNLVGLDIEQADDRIDKLAPRFCHSNELAFLEERDSVRKTIVWCIKEAVYKLFNVAGIDFRDHIQVTPFQLTNQTIEITYQPKGQNITKLSAHFKVLEDYVVVIVFYPN